MKIEIEHFYWAAQSNGGPEGQPAYHVQVFRMAETMEEVAELGGQARQGATLNMEQAAAVGLDLSKLREVVNTDLARLLDEARQDLQKLTAVNETLLAQLQDATARAPA